MTLVVPVGSPLQERSVMESAATVPCLTVIITNYNYESYVSKAIESALAVRGLPVEVIVVDDGSTDNSRAVIDRFGAAVVKIYQSNQSQTAACNAGFVASHGEIVIFLDADDVLDPTLGISLLAVWNKQISKVQFQMQRIDQSGTAFGKPFPAYYPHPTPERIRCWFRMTSAYPTPPGSGNAYARWFLKQIFPLDPSTDRAADFFCLSAAPWLGNVVTVRKPLMLYRVHGGNMSKTTAFATHVQRAMSRLHYAQTIAARKGFELSSSRLFRSLETTQFRAASIRLSSQAHPIHNDSHWRTARDALWALLFYSQVTLPRRVVLVAWVFLVLYLPGPFARRIIHWRYRIVLPTPASYKTAQS